MKKRIALVLSVICLLALLVALASCGHEHAPGKDWQKDATNHWKVCSVEGEECAEKLNVAAHDYETVTKDSTCTEKGLITKTCKVCGFEQKTDVAVKPHDYADATCTEPKTCKDCGATDGEALGHKGGTATCTAQAVCETCGEGYGELIPHDYADATCTLPKTCRDCGATDGEALGHKGGTATCVDKAVCDVCSEPYGEPLGHKGGTATCTVKATCEVCSEEYGDFAFHTVDKGVCTVCSAVLPTVGLEGVDMETSHTGGGAANKDKLFDGDKASTGIYTVGDKEYSPEAVGDYLQITFKNEIYLKEIAIWQVGNWSYAEVYFFAADGSLLYKESIAFDNVLEGAGDSKAKYIKLENTELVKSIRIICTALTWDSGKTEKISEIEIFVSACVEHYFIDATCTEAKRCAYCGVTDGEPLGHKGGTATCTEKAVCDACGEAYGDEPTGHKGGEATCTAKAKCEVCKQEYGETLPHTGGTATCTAKAKCDVCEQEYGETLPHAGGEATCSAKAKCDTCGQEYGGFAHTGGAATCTMSAICELCGCFYGEAPKGHTGGTATCTEKAKCDTCGQEYGKLGHKGGTATCTAKAKCDTCGEEYGEFKHAYDRMNKGCSICGAKLAIAGADDVESMTTSHTGGGAANKDKLFDGEKKTTGVWSYGDKEYAALENGDYIVIALKEETVLHEAIFWACGNYSVIKVEFMDESGKVVHSTNLIYDIGAADGGDSGSLSVILDGKAVKYIKMTAINLKWGAGRTGKTSEIELYTNTPVEE